MNKKSIALVVIVLLGLGAYFFFGTGEKVDNEPNVVEENNISDNTASATEEVGETSTSTEDVAELPYYSETKIGMSVEGRAVNAHHYGNGETEILFVGGIHGGYSWNTTLLARELMDYLSNNPSLVESDLRVTVIPLLNPDGLAKTVEDVNSFTEADVPSSLEATVAGRFNANDVDLNRNFDCDWSQTATWQKRSVSGGEVVFSEPESKAIRDYVKVNNISAVIVWYSSVGGVFASNCHDGILPETLELTNLYSKASGYDAYEEFNFYAITGDMVNWLANEEIPAISVLLTTHEDIEWEKNKKGIDAVLKEYSGGNEET
jgi:hypothetical protein